MTVQMVLPRWTGNRFVRMGACVTLAAGGALFFFAPRFGAWRGLGISSWTFLPELNRAVDALKQLEHPFAPIQNPQNIVLQWRLLFPVLGYAVALPGWAYLALPLVGCLLALWFVAQLLERNGVGWRGAVAAALLTATCSWFFVSTGWLAYFDSWCVLGLLVATFSHSRGMPVVAVLLTPWVDERFVFALPLCLLARDTYTSIFLQRGLSVRRREAAWLLVASLPWVLVRAGIFLMHNDQVTVGYVSEMIAANRATKPTAYLIGSWYGLRWAWALPLILLAFLLRVNRARAAMMLALLMGTLAVLFALATDLSRSVSVVIPLAVLGALMLQRQDPNRFLPRITALCVLNLFFPARHVIGNNTIEIFYLHTELNNMRRPPAELSVQTYNDRAHTIVSNGGLPQALELLNVAIQLDPEYSRSYSNRASVHFRMGNLPEAIADADRSLELAPEQFAARFNRGLLRIAAGNLAGAKEDLERALHEAPPTWSYRADAELKLHEVETTLEHH